MQSSRDYSFIWSVPLVEGVEAFKAHFTHFSYARHSHDTYALGTIDECAMRFWHGGADHIAANDTVIAINPDEVHDGRSGSLQGCYYRMLYIEGSAIERLFDRDSFRIRGSLALRGPVQRDEQLVQYIGRVHHMLDCLSVDPAVSLEQQSRFVQVLYLIFSRYGVARLEKSDAVAGKQYVDRAKEYMAKHLGEPLRLTDLSLTVGLSPFYFLRTFRLITGMPPHSYLYQLRLDQARILLRRRQAPVAVAAELGFTDQSHLTRRFKAAFGGTPSQYMAAQHILPPVAD